MFIFGASNHKRRSHLRFSSQNIAISQRRAAVAPKMDRHVVNQALSISFAEMSEPSPAFRRRPCEKPAKAGTPAATAKMDRHAVDQGVQSISSRFQPNFRPVNCS